MRLAKFLIGVLAVGLVSPAILPAVGEIFGPNIRVNVQTNLQRNVPAIAVGWDGTVYAVWQDDASGNWRIMFAHAAGSGGTFSGHVPVAMSPPPGSIEQSPDIALFNDTVYVVWQDDRGGQGNNIYFATIPVPAGIPQPEKRINSEAGTGYRESPAIAVAPNGTIYVAYDNSSNDVWLTASYDGGETWTPGSLVSDSLVNTRGEQKVAVDRLGKVYVIWRDGRSGMIDRGGGVFVDDDDVYIANSTDGGRTFGLNTPVNDVIVGKVQGSPAIAIDGNGRIHAAWKDERFAANQVTDIFYAHSDDGRHFSTNVPVNDTGVVAMSPKQTTHQQPSMGVDPLGKNIYIAWVDDRSKLTGQNPNHNVYVAKSTDGGISFHPANVKADGADFFIDDAATPNGVWDTNEARIEDNGNNVLDPGKLDGSPDKVVVPGVANLQRDLTGTRISYHDANSDLNWQPDEDIVMSQGPGGTFTGIRPSSLAPWDTTGLGVSLLYFSDTVSMAVAPGKIMAVDGFDTTAAGLSPTDPLSAVSMKMMYRANSTYTGTAPVNWALQGGSNASWFSPVDTGGLWTNVTLDLFALGVNTVPAITNLNVSLLNNGAGSVSVDQLILNVTRGTSGAYDLSDTVVYDGATATNIGDPLRNFTDMDAIAFIDVNMSGTYDRGEPILHQFNTMPPFGALEANDEVLTRADGPAWSNVFKAFPVNDDPPGADHYMTRLVLNPFDYVNVAWQDWRRNAADIYMSTAPTNGTFGPYMAFWMEAAERRAGPNGRVAFNIWVRNVGGIAAANVTVTDLLPPGLDFVQSNPPPTQSAGGTMTWDLGFVSSLGVHKLVIEARMNSSVPLNTIVWTQGRLDFNDLLLSPRPEMYAAISFVASDLVPPAIVHHPPSDVQAGTSLSLSATVTDDSSISEVRLFVKPVGAIYFNSPVLMSRVGTTDEYIIAFNIGGATGVIEYYIEAEDVYGNQASSPGDAPTTVHHVNVVGGTGGEFPILAVAAVAVILAGVIIAIILLVMRKRRKTEMPPADESSDEDI